METAHDHLLGNLTSFESARRIFVTNILTALNCRFVENPGILKTCGVIDLLKFPLNTDEAKGIKYFFFYTCLIPILSLFCSC